MTLLAPERLMDISANPLKSASAMLPTPPVPFDPPTVNAPAVATLTTLNDPRPLTVNLVRVLLPEPLPMVTLPFTVNDCPAPMVMVLAAVLLVWTSMAPPKPAEPLSRFRLLTFALVLVAPKVRAPDREALLLITVDPPSKVVVPP